MMSTVKRKKLSPAECAEVIEAARSIMGARSYAALADMAQLNRESLYNAAKGRSSRALAQIVEWVFQSGRPIPGEIAKMFSESLTLCQGSGIIKSSRDGD